jgi:hypothetical protein
VLRFERLEDDFDELMRSQALPMRLRQADRNISHHLPSNLTRAAVADAETLEAVREAYSDDFALLGYDAANATRSSSRACEDLADASLLGAYDLTERPHVCKGGKLE